MNALYQDLLNQDINNVKIIAIGKGHYSADNSKWTDDNTIPVVNDPSPNDIWTNWDASQWDLFFFDTNGNYVTSAQCYADILNDCTSWKCDSDYVESCSGSTTYLPPFTNFDNASDHYIATYPTIDLSFFTFSVATIPLSNTAYWMSLGFTPCTPPVSPFDICSFLLV